MRTQQLLLPILIALALVTTACARQIMGGPTPNPMTAYCGASKAIGGAHVTVSGTARYEKLTLPSCASGSCLFTVTPTAIRYAEVRVTSASGDLTQCGETDGSGNFSLDLPQSSGAYTIHVSSRAYNSKLQAYVLNNNIDNSFYTLDLTVGSDSTQTGLSLLAPSGSSTSRSAGAFNILDELVVANDFLRDATATAASTDSNGLPVGGCANGSFFPNCQPFNVGPLAYAYWSKGVNPGSGSSGVSYYVPGTSSLYILGGSGGIVDGEDSDEFDSSVIIHEYGHFLEEHYGHSDSPGGSHNGHEIIDPRLAWSEGWADFFQAAVRKDNTYIDIRNTTPGHGEYGIYEYLSNETGPPNETVSFDPVGALGEGTFREFSITRALWAVLKQTGFSEVWSVFSGSNDGTTSGFHSGDLHFRNVSLLHKLHAENAAALSSDLNYTNWSSEQSAEKQYADLRAYGAPLTAGVCTSAQILLPDTQFNMHAGDAFYDYVPTSTGAHQLTLNYFTPHTEQIDVDLYVFGEGYSYACQLDLFGSCESQDDVVRKGVVAKNNDAETFTTASAQDCIDAQIPAGSCAGYDKATVTLAAPVNAGQHYLINTSSYTYAAASPGPQVYFTLSIDGQNQCPQP